MDFKRSKKSTMPRSHQAGAASCLICFKGADFTCRGKTSHS